MRYAWEFEDPDHPRPAEVAVLEAFLNTVDHHRFGVHAQKPDEDRDLFHDPGAAAAWLRRWDLLEEERPLTERQLREATALRDGLRAWLLRRQGHSHDGHALAACQSLLDELHLIVVLHEQSVAAVPSDRGVRAALTRLAGDVATADATGALTRLKICAAEDCRFVYYDHSRSRTGRWCSMQVCGNRVKTRRYRAHRGMSE